MQETLTNKDSTSAIELLDLSNNRSVVWTAKEQVEVQHRHVPELGDGDILVEVISTGICGSDVHVWSSNHENQPPVMGHESAGSIIRLGSKVTDRFIGQRVAIEPGFPCMKCEYCIRGKPNICANLSYCGHTKDGTLTRFHVAPQELTVPIPDTVSWEQAGCIQPLAIAVQLARRANMRAQQTVAIFGCGPLGLLTLAVARAYGVKKIIVFDVDQIRIDFALEYGAGVGVLCPMKPKDGIEPLAFAAESMDKVIREHNLGSGVDLSIEASGAEACAQMAVVITKPGGTYIQAGLGKSLTAVPLSLLTAKELTMKGTVRYTPGCFADAVDLLARKLVDLAPLITSVYPLTKANDAFKAQQARQGIKIIIMNQE